MSGLYIHVPFCVRKCLYCDFYSEEESGASVAQRLKRARPPRSDFLEALDRELALLPVGFSPSTLFIGGGTPTELSPRDFEQLLQMIRRRVDLSGVIEWSCEANPGTLTGEHAVLMKEAGINRVSLGVQSFDARALQFLGRIHDPEEAEQAFHLLRQHGFDNLNLDLIYAVPGFGLETTVADLERIRCLEPDHVACYGLMFEEGTPLDGLRLRGHVQPVDEALELEQYNLVRDTLAAGGWERYEISNYARNDNVCRHNMLYWSGGAYIGCGPSAHSHRDGVRSSNVRDVGAYRQALAEGRLPRDFEERLEPADRARETLLMTLRQAKGLDLDAFEQETGFTVAALCGPAVEELCRQGLLELNNRRLKLTERALFVSDAVFAELAG